MSNDALAKPSRPVGRGIPRGRKADGTISKLALKALLQHAMGLLEHLGPLELPIMIHINDVRDLVWWYGQVTRVGETNDGAHNDQQSPERRGGDDAAAPPAQPTEL